MNNKKDFFSNFKKLKNKTNSVLQNNSKHTMTGVTNVSTIGMNNQNSPIYYETYLPNAFDESLTIIEKVNKVIFQLNTLYSSDLALQQQIDELHQMIDDLISQWRQFLVDFEEWKTWLETEGLLEAVRIGLDELVDNGTLSSIINDELLTDINQKIEVLDNELEELSVEVDENYETLNQKIDSITGNLGSPGGVYETYDELVANHPNGDDQIYVVIADGNWYYWDVETNTWLSGGLYQAPLESNDYVVKYPSKNLFNPTTRTDGFYIDFTTGILTPNANYFSSDFISVTASTNYIKTGTDQMAFYDDMQNYISGIEVTPDHFTTPSNASFIRVTANLSMLSTYQVETGTTRTEYVPYGSKMKATDIEEDSIDETQLKYDYAKLLPSRNMFDKESISEGTYVSYLSGSIEVNPNFFSSEHIRVEGDTNYIKNDNQQLAFYDENLTFISGIEFTPSYFTSPINASYVIICATNDRLELLQLEEGIITTDYVPYSYGINGDDVLPGVIEDFHLIEDYSMLVQSRNLFYTETITPGHYISWSTGQLIPSVDFFTSDYIHVNEGDDYIKNDTQQIAFFDIGKKYVGGIASTTTSFKAPNDSYYVRICGDNDLLYKLQLEKGQVETQYTSGGKVVARDSIEDVETIAYQHESNMEIQLPDNILTVVGESVDFHWRNIIKHSEVLENGYYLRTQRKATNGSWSSIGEDYGYKWTYTPTTVEVFDLEIHLVNIITDTIIKSKTVKINVFSKAPTSKTATVVTIGDSFTDGYGVSKYIHDFTLETSTLNMIGLHDTGKSNVYDDAWGGQGFEWYAKSDRGYLRSDRPLEDAFWDDGWGMNEPNGWLPGDTYEDLTPEQKQHGFTKNQFYDINVGKFNFGYYMNTYFPSYTPSNQSGNHVDGVVIMLGLNDSIWREPGHLETKIDTLTLDVQNIVDSIQTWDSNIKVALSLVTPQSKDDSFMNSYGNTMLHSKRAKYSQEIWNSAILDKFNNSTYINKGVYVLHTNAHFDSRYGIITKEITPVKFDNTIVETVTADVHPTVVGAKYIADTNRNFIVGKVIK